MIKVGFTSYFVRRLKRIEKTNKILFEEILEKLELLGHRNNHNSLRVHKLHGDLKEYYAFSINYKIRIVFKFVSNNHAILYDIDDHDIYKR